MAPFIHLLIALACSTAILASPHSRYGHAHRAVVPHHPIVRVDSPSIPLPRRKRSLNKRCIPRPSNSTTSALPSSTPAYSTPDSSTPTYSSTAPLNVAPAPATPYPTPSSSTPTPTSTPAPSPTPTPTPTSSAAPTSSSPPPAQQSSSSGSSGEPSYLIGTQMGQGTYYATGLGACGITNSDSDYIAAVSHSLFDTYPQYNGVDPNTNPVCGKKVTATYQGKSVTVTITDRCVACQVTDLDFSPAAFNTLADPSVGRIDMTWKWV